MHLNDATSFISPVDLSVVVVVATAPRGT